MSGMVTGYTQAIVSLEVGMLYKCSLPLWEINVYPSLHAAHEEHIAKLL